MKNIKLVVFDMDGTLITNNTWYDFNISMGVKPEEDYSLYQAYSKKEINYTQLD